MGEGGSFQKRLLITIILSIRKGLKTKGVPVEHACLIINTVELGKTELRVAHKHLGEVRPPMLMPLSMEAPGKGTLGLDKVITDGLAAQYPEMVNKGEEVGLLKEGL